MCGEGLSVYVICLRGGASIHVECVLRGFVFIRFV